MRSLALLLTVSIAFLCLNCGPLPPDPATLPENASIKVIAIDVDNQFKEPVKVSEETSIQVTFRLSLPDFIDSISIEIQSSEEAVEYYTSVEKPWDTTTFAMTLQFPSSGTKALIYTAWMSNGIEKAESIIFDVAARFTNASPVLSPKTIELFSEKGVSTTRNLMPYVTDPDNDKITFEIKGQESVLPFMLKDSLLSSSAALEVGNYVLSIVVSDGILSDVGTILWKVYTPPDGSSDIEDDIAETIKNTPVLVNVLENDDLPSGSLLSYTSQGKNGKTIIADGKVRYTPKSGFTGDDTLFYLVNGVDTGWVYVTVNESEIENRRPVWAPDTVELYSPEGVVSSADVAPYASDPDNDALLFDVTIPDDATFEVNNSVIASMAEMEEGTYYLLVTVSDGEEITAGVIKWTVFELQDVEISPVDDSTELEEGGSKVIKVLDNDEGVSDAEGIFITSVSQGLHGSATIQGGTMVRYTPESGFSGSDTVIYVVNGKDTGKVIITVLDKDPNAAPEWSTDSVGKSSITGIAGSLDLEPYASDSDDDELTFSIASAPESGFSLQEGTQLTVDAEVAEGEYTVVVTVSDGEASADMTVVWAVLSPAEAELEINDDEAEVVAGNIVTVDVLANDEVVSGEAQLVVTATTDPSHGSVSVSDDGIVYSSDVNYEGDDSFMYIVNGTDTGTVTVTVGSAEVTVVEDRHSLSENGSITVNVLENDVAPDGLLLSVESVIQGTLGSAIVIDDSTVGYEAATDASGTDTVRYVLSNGDTGLVVLTIAAIEYSLTDDATSVQQGHTREIMVLANDAVNVGALTVTGVTDASKGSVSFTDSSVLYTAAGDAEGSDELTYSVNNGKASATLTITFLAIEIVANDDSLTIDEDAETQIVAVLENDVITEGETMILTAVSEAQLGTVSIDETNENLIYTPSEDSSGTEIITYTINDAVDGLLKVVIHPINDPPVVSSFPGDKTIDEDDSTSLQINEFVVTDKDKDNLFINLQTGSDYRIENNNTTTARIIPNNNYYGDLHIQVRIHDGKDSSATHSFTVTVNPLPDDPMIDINVNSTTIPFGDPIPVSISYSDPDAAGIASAKLHLDGVEYTDIGQSPATINVIIPHGPQALGTHTITAIAVDDRGVTAADSIAVTIVESFATDSIYLSAILTANGIPGTSVRDFCTISGNRITELDLSDTITTLPSEIGNLTALTELELNFNNLTSLPAAIWTLDKLTSLNLYGNDLTSLPPEISQLTNLTHLYLGSNPIASLPTELFSLTSLERMYLHGTDLATFPAGIGNLINLTHLNISSTELTGLPAEFVNLTSLTWLCFDQNSHTTIPDEIWSLTGLSELSIQYNGLTAVPQQIMNLTNLTKLNLGSNQLTTVPDDLANLSNLQILNLYGNQLQILPSVITSITTLRELVVGGNDLSTLPSSIENLTNLDHLAAQNNQLTSLPSEIQNLSQLRVLYLYNNLLSSLPDEIANLTNVQHLRLDDNNLTPGSPTPHAWEDWATERDSDWATTQNSP